MIVYYVALVLRGRVCTSEHGRGSDEKGGLHMDGGDLDCFVLVKVILKLKGLCMTTNIGKRLLL